MHAPENILIPLFFKLNEWFHVFKNNNKHNKKDIILLGQGWFSKGFMEHIDKSKFKITNIYRNSFVNTPMLLQTIKSNDMYFYNTNKKVSKFTSLIDVHVKDEIIKIDLDKSIIHTKEKKMYSWKNGYLVCGLGSNTDIGYFWNLNINNLKKLDTVDAGLQSERTSRTPYKICIVGAGPTGTELAFHLNDLKHKITLYDGLPDVYTYLTPYGKNYILDKLYFNDIKLVTNKMFSEDDNKLFDKVIFAIGSRPNDLTSKWETTKQLQLIGYDNIYVGSDGIMNKGLPRNAQLAYQQGKYIALKLNNTLSSKQINDDFKFENKGIALYIGNGMYYVELVLFGKVYNMKISEKIMNIYYNLFK
jgi:NADH dehydrogenase FAD-containing subunit